MHLDTIWLKRPPKHTKVWTISSGVCSLAHYERLGKLGLKVRHTSSNCSSKIDIHGGVTREYTIHGKQVDIKAQ